MDTYFNKKILLVDDEKETYPYFETASLNLYPSNILYVLIDIYFSSLLAMKH
ncbi:TPA: hypothetical protein ACKOR7_001003 [Clostridioides difficile]